MNQITRFPFIQCLGRCICTDVFQIMAIDILYLASPASRTSSRRGVVSVTLRCCSWRGPKRLLIVFGLQYRNLIRTIWLPIQTHRPRHAFGKRTSDTPHHGYGAALPLSSVRQPTGRVSTTRSVWAHLRGGLPRTTPS